MNKCFSLIVHQRTKYETVSRAWIEHAASRSSVLRSADWAIETCWFEKSLCKIWILSCVVLEITSLAATEMTASRQLSIELLVGGSLVRSFLMGGMNRESNRFWVCRFGRKNVTLVREQGNWLANRKRVRVQPPRKTLQHTLHPIK